MNLRLSDNTALAVSVGVLGAVSTWLTATVLPVPVWVLFLAWASFFFCGGGRAGAVRGLLCNLAGIVIATLTLLVVTAGGGSVLLLGAAVGVGSAAMMLSSRIGVLAAAPAIVFGFAMTVGTIAATGTPITTVSATNPALLAAAAAVAGVVFGLASEWLAGMLRGRRRDPAPS
ncbi:DUF1097 domain-containing protein [Pseudonocardia sp. WMMC193]|uniref:DUF1097 domain-containing protein n=1 Tax=Pseudonocardia sp. WMMC193 TaxID=2911965 RepID=UPI001F2B2944|nr:DUF1097 domain-containing protein [Pseudonocardia sp. WMMC193]MCF7553413.1 DUF1097 domain-containing protein [Pseudonocardia sp. WMMC193]